MRACVCMLVVGRCFVSRFSFRFGLSVSGFLFLVFCFMCLVCAYGYVDAWCVQADTMGMQLMFCNSYHLLLHPGPDLIESQCSTPSALSVAVVVVDWMPVCVLCFFWALS